jgi:hypothetical protein
MKNLSLTLALTVALASSVFAAPIEITSVVGGAPSGTTLTNFDDFDLNNSTQSTNGITVSFDGSAQAVQGSVHNQYAAPFLSGSNGIGFGPGGTDQGDGPDTTTYLSAGTGSITFDFDVEQKYLGLLWGSVDDYNTLQFYDGDELLQTYTGLDVWDSANGDRGAQGTFYVNINNLDGTFNRVVASSSTNSFEIDNMAHSTENHVPDSGTTVTLMGLALLSLAAIRRLF